MKRIVTWRRIDTLGLEYAVIVSDPLRLEGEVVLIEDHVPCAVSYQVDCDAAGLTARAFVRMKREGAQSERVFARDSGGHWTIDGNPIPQLYGLADIDLSVTPSTNTAPIRRLGLSIGQKAEVTAAWVRFPTLDVVPLRQVYRRVGAASYQYEAPELAFAAELRFDSDGIVEDYGGLWARAI